MALTVLNPEKEYEIVAGQPEEKAMGGARHGGIGARLLIRLAACRREKSNSGLNGSWGKNRRPAPKAVARLGRLGPFHHWFFVLQTS